jgi:glycosyltransferase involved in cell wall biosynthesis
MKIGILGTRGIPNAYGGFEQFAQYLSQGMVRRGHSVWVYNSSDHPYQDNEWNGIRIIHCADWESRIGTAGQFIYDYNCLKDARNRDFDILLQLGYTSNSVWHRYWPKQMLNIVNMDGLEWKRSKYGPLTRKFLKRAEGWAARRGDVLIADSIGIRDYLLQEYQRSSIYIPYGAEIPDSYDASIPARWDLGPGNYFLLMARMEPENNIEMIIRGWMDSDRSIPLVLIGNPGNAFGQRMVTTYQHERLRFIGAIYEAQVVHSLRHFSALYLHGHSVGGTNPSLLEAMACGCSIAAHDNPFNKAILGEDAGYFATSGDVTEMLGHLPTGQLRADRRQNNLDKINTLYNWEKIIADYEEVFLRTLTPRL